MGEARPVASFVDLRRVAAEVLPSLAGTAGMERYELSLPPGPVSVGVLRVACGRYADVSNVDEFVVVIAGAVELETEAGDCYSMSPGDSAVISGGTRLHWQAQTDAVLVFMRYATGDQGREGIVPIDPRAERTPSGAPLAELLTTSTPACWNHTDYRSNDGEFVCGTWDSTPYTRKPMRYRHYELMHLLDGEVTFVDARGQRGTFGRGDIFLVEQGAECSWDSQVYVRKVYAIWRPA